MKIQIDHIAKIEGHAGFLSHVTNQEFEKAKIEVTEGARLIEGLLLNRPFSDIPDIVSRICGICPTVHNITASKALEKAFKINPPKEAELLRKILLYAQIIHSHSLHLYFLSLPDFISQKNSIKFSLENKNTELALKIREYSARLIKIIGGRTIHPVNLTVGGLKTIPPIESIKEILLESEAILPDTIKFAKIFTELKYPDHSKGTNYVSLFDKNYPLYNSRHLSFNKEKIPLEKLYQNLKEEYSPHHNEKRTKINNQIVMVGALARINNQKEKLSQKASKALNFETPQTNIFYNISAQAIEIIHATEIIIQSLKKYIQEPLKEIADPKPRKGKGLAASEAPRGTLFHYYETDDRGKIINANIIAPTGIFLNNLEDDCTKYLNSIDKDLSRQEIKDKIRTLIRAYDPCIACATH